MNRRFATLLGAASAYVLAVLALIAAPAAEGVAITLGPPDLSAADPFAACDSLVPESCSAKTFIPTVLPAPGARLVTPADGTITAWRVKGAPPAKLRLRIVQATGDGRYKGIATSGIAKVSDGKTDNQVAISIDAGQQLGVDLVNAFPESSSTLLGDADAPGAAWVGFFPGLGDEATAAPSLGGGGSLPMFNATVELQRPIVFNLTATAGPQTGGQLLAVNGAHLTIADSVSFGGVPAEVLVARPGQILVSTPPHPPGPVSVIVTTAGGSNPDTPANLYTYTPVAPQAPDTSPPALSALTITPYAFVARRRAQISLRSSEPGSLRLTLQRKPRRGPFKAVKGSRASALAAGRNVLPFRGRWNGRALHAGRYRLLLVAVDALGNRSRPKRLPFLILPPDGRQ